MNRLLKMNLADLKKLAGVTTNRDTLQGSNISITGSEKGQLMRQHNIKPGTDEWFRLWFTLPYLTNTSPLDPKYKD